MVSGSSGTSATPRRPSRCGFRASSTAGEPPRRRWTALAPMLVALAVGVMIAAVITLIEVLA
jgi:hypothetical protein